MYPNAVMIVLPFTWTEAKSDFKGEPRDQVPAGLMIVNGKVMSGGRDNV